MYRLYHAVEVYTGMYKTAGTGLETCARSARVSKVSKVLCILVYSDTARYKVFIYPTYHGNRGGITVIYTMLTMNPTI